MLRDQVRTANALSVNEIYETIQGEGLLVGTPSLFIRLQGCNLRCPWCDQPEALDKREEFINIEDILERAERSSFRHAVITGGEPFLQPELHLLVKGLLERGFSVQIETNGTLWIPGLEEVADKILHITCSPKAVAKFFVHPKILEHAKELKFVVDEELSTEVLLRDDFLPFLKRGLVVLQPESNRRDMFEKALRIVEEFAQRGFLIRVIPQLHKFLGIP